MNNYLIEKTDSMYLAGIQWSLSKKDFQYFLLWLSMGEDVKNQNE